jgi:hypothetical protein
MVAQQSESPFLFDPTSHSPQLTLFLFNFYFMLTSESTLCDVVLFQVEHFPPPFRCANASDGFVLITEVNAIPDMCPKLCQP